MAAFDDLAVDLAVEGAVVLLREPAPLDWHERLANGVSVRLGANSRGVVVENLQQGSVHELRILARDCANEALDLMAVRSVGSLALSDPTTAALTWQPRTSGATMRIAWEISSTFRGRVGGLPHAYPLVWHPSFRYFRMSQTTSDLYDAFRNVYLAIESALSDIELASGNASGKPEREGAWLVRALSAAEGALQAGTPARCLRDYLSAGFSSTDPVKDVKDELYAGTRTHLFHAKAGRPVALPLDATEQARVLDALTRYAQLYTDLIELRFGARFLRSGMSDYAVGQMLDTAMTSWELGVSGREYATEQELEHAPATELAMLPSRRAPELDDSRRGVVVAEAQVDGLQLPPLIAGVVVRTEGDKFAAWDDLGGLLDLAGVANLEIEVGYEILSDGTRITYDS